MQHIPMRENMHIPMREHIRQNMYIVAIDTSFGKRILIMKVKTKAIIKNISRYFDFNA